MTHRILILGGTTEARQLARRPGSANITLSLAGRTAKPAAQPVPVRIGGFGGSEGLARYLRGNAVDLLIDATHPYAARISTNAWQAARIAGVQAFAPTPAMGAGRGRPLALRRECRGGRSARPNASTCLPGARATRRSRRSPQRLSTSIWSAASTRLSRRSTCRTPPTFWRAGHLKKLTSGSSCDHRIDTIVAKNSGGVATYGKIAAARASVSR